MQASNLGSRSLTSVTMYALVLPSPVIPGRVEARDDNMHTCDPRLMFDGASIQKRLINQYIETYSLSSNII